MIVLTLTMIGGVITVVALLVTRIPQGFGTLPVLPPAITLPEGASPQALTFGRGWIGVVVSGPQGQGDRFLVFAPDGDLRRSVDLTAP